jgi:hypothetical protein
LFVDDSTRATSHEDDPIAKANCFAHVVGDKNDGEFLLCDDCFNLVVKVVARHGVKRSEWLIHQYNLGSLGEAACEGYALAHPAGQLVRPFVCPLPKTHDLE